MTVVVPESSRNKQRNSNILNKPRVAGLAYWDECENFHETIQRLNDGFILVNEKTPVWAFIKTGDP